VHYSYTLFFTFWFILCFAATQLARQVQQERTQMVYSNREAQKRLTESNGTPAVDLGFGFLFFCLCFAATQLARQLQQECTQVGCNKREAQKRPARGHSRT